MVHAHIAGTIEIPQPDLLTFILVVPGTITSPCRGVTLSARLELHALLGLAIIWHLWTWTRKAVPDSSSIICLVLWEWKTAQVVASDVVAKIPPIVDTGRSSTIPIVEGYSDSEVHASIDQRLRCLHLDLEATDPFNAKFVPRSISSRNYFILNVPHDARQVASVDIQRWIGAVPLSAIHMESEEISTAGFV